MISVKLFFPSYILFNRSHVCWYVILPRSQTRSVCGFGMYFTAIIDAIDNTQSVSFTSVIHHSPVTNSSPIFPPSHRRSTMRRRKFGLFISYFIVQLKCWLHNNNNNTRTPGDTELYKVSCLVSLFSFFLFSSPIQFPIQFTESLSLSFSENPLIIALLVCFLFLPSCVLV